MKACQQILLIFWIGFYYIVDADVPNVINLPNGNKLKGVVLQSHHSKRAYVEFRGLRYAYPPLGELRLKPTRLLDDFGKSHEEDATEYGNICPQLDPWYDPNETEDGSWEDLKVLGHEDCLFANVATSHTEPEASLPVLVWIHGGNFQSESGQDYGVSKFMDHDIVVVTFNYRIGALGFLNSEDGNYNGNQGLKDQKILLEWVRKYIHIFGGNPSSVTLGGVNAGGTATHLHMLSNFSRGLFDKAIIQSGTAISPWVLMKDPKERLQKLAKHLQCGNDSDVGMCIAQKDAANIVQKTPKLTEWFLDPIPFGPSIEIHGDMQERFLAADPYTILAEGNYWARDIPVIMGVNSHEGLLYAMDIGHQAMLRMVFNREWFGAAPISLYYKKTAVDSRTASEAIRNYYFPLTEEDSVDGAAKLVDKNYRFENITNLYSDRHFFIPLHHSAKLMGKFNKLYLYWFDFVSEQSVHGLYGYTNANAFGPSHYDQLQYLFDTPFFNETTQDDHIEFAKTFVHGFYTFINDGSPFFDAWDKVDIETDDEAEAYVFNRFVEPPVMEPFRSRIDFWNGLYLMEYDKANFINELIQEQESNDQHKDEL